MRTRVAIVSIACLALSGCCCHRALTPTVIKDSVRVEIREREVIDTVTVTIPVEVEKIVTRDTVSHLENTYAESDAEVRGGFLFHSLASRPQVIKVPVTVYVTDTLYKESQTVEKEVQVEKPLSWMQKLKLGAFWWLLGAVAALLLWTFRKLFI